jgi:hypothetical protein
MLRALAVAVALPLAPASLGAQDLNVILAAEDAEARLGHSPFEILEFRTIRPGGRPRLAHLSFPDSENVWVKWTPAPRGGAADNAEPRYEIAAYRLQKLFLDEAEYVVPPTLPRVVAPSSYPDHGAGVRATFAEADGVLVVLQLWLQEVTSRGVWDEARLLEDSVYARHAANANILTYLINHGDSNTGNFLIARDTDRPRLFSVDNGIAFSATPSRDGAEWRHLRVRRLPRATVERLRSIRLADLEAVLGVVVQLEVHDGELVLVEPGRNLAPRRPVRRQGDVIQLGLTANEIAAVARRLRDLLRDIDRGRIETF